eukprot:104349-Heterocapsa_arctica.AAC.1
MLSTRHDVMRHWLHTLGTSPTSLPPPRWLPSSTPPHVLGHVVSDHDVVDDHSDPSSSGAFRTGPRHLPSRLPVEARCLCGPLHHQG